MYRYALVVVAALATADSMEAQAPRVAAAVDLRSLSNGMNPSVGMMFQAALVRARNERGSIALGPEMIFHYQGVDRGAPCSTDRTVACERSVMMGGGAGVEVDLGKPPMFIESGFRASAGNLKSLWTPIAVGVRW